MKKNVLFALYDAFVEEQYEGSGTGWTPLSGLCANQETGFARVHLFCWNHSLKRCLEDTEKYRLLNPDAEFMHTVLPFENMAELMQSKENQVCITEHIYNAVIHYQFNYIEEEYFCYFQGAHNFLRAFLYYFATRRMVLISTVEILPPVHGVKFPGKLVTSKVDMRVYENLSRIIRETRYDSYSFLKAGIATRNNGFNTTIAQIEHVASNSQDALLVLGPTGAGKSELVRRIYQLKAMKKNLSGPFVDVSCAAIRGDAAQSMLFGHVKGAFTGALRHRDGLLKTAHNGLLFLDEIGVLGLEEQALLLKAIEEKRFFPFGSDREVSSDFQLICGTNLDLGNEVRAGRFRADLYARINLWTFHLPGLAERPEDIEPNLDFELNRLQEKSGLHLVFSHPARKLFLDFSVSPQALWLGNFRDFSAAVRRMALLADTGVIGLELVEEEIQRLLRLWQNNVAPKSRPQPYFCCSLMLGPVALAALDSFDLVQLEEALRVCARSSSLSSAGRALFAVSRHRRASTNDADRLRKFLKRFDLDWATVKPLLEQNNVAKVCALTTDSAVDFVASQAIQ